jgi:uncharacterized protein
MPVLMHLARIIISEISDNQVIYLKEHNGERQFPILIGLFEATSIDRRVKVSEKPQRPLTHDVIVQVAETMGGVIEAVVITELKDHTYYAQLRIQHMGKIVEVDCRPSDAIAVAVTFDPPLPIYVAEEVLEQAAS